MLWSRQFKQRSALVVIVEPTKVTAADFCTISFGTEKSYWFKKKEAQQLCNNFWSTVGQKWLENENAGISRKTMMPLRWRIRTPGTEVALIGKTWYSENIFPSVRRNIFSDFLSKKSKCMYFIRTLSEMFSAKFSKLHSTCPAKHFELIFSKKLCLWSSSSLSKKLRTSAGLSKMHSIYQEDHVWGGGHVSNYYLNSFCLEHERRKNRSLSI